MESTNNSKKDIKILNLNFNSNNLENKEIFTNITSINSSIENKKNNVYNKSKCMGKLLSNNDRINLIKNNENNLANDNNFNNDYNKKTEITKIKKKISFENEKSKDMANYILHKDKDIFNFHNKSNKTKKNDLYDDYDCDSTENNLLHSKYQVSGNLIQSYNIKDKF